MGECQLKLLRSKVSSTEIVEVSCWMKPSARPREQRSTSLEHINSVYIRIAQPSNLASKSPRAAKKLEIQEEFPQLSGAQALRHGRKAMGSCSTRRTLGTLGRSQRFQLTRTKTKAQSPHYTRFKRLERLKRPNFSGILPTNPLGCTDDRNLLLPSDLPVLKLRACM